MAEAPPNTNFAATGAFNPASNPETEKGHPLPDAAHDVPASSNASTQLKPDHSPSPPIEPDAAYADEKASPSNEPQQTRDITGVRWVVVVLAILSSTFLFALDNTVVADVQPKIVERFGQIQKLPWLPIAFLVAAVGTNLIWYALKPAVSRAFLTVRPTGARSMVNLMPSGFTLVAYFCSRSAARCAVPPTP